MFKTTVEKKKEEWIFSVFFSVNHFKAKKKKSCWIIFIQIHNLNLSWLFVFFVHLDIFYFFYFTPSVILACFVTSFLWLRQSCVKMRKRRQYIESWTFSVDNIHLYWCDWRDYSSTAFMMLNEMTVGVWFCLCWGLKCSLTFYSSCENSTQSICLSLIIIITLTYFTFLLIIQPTGYVFPSVQWLLLWRKIIKKSYIADTLF